LSSALDEAAQLMDSLGPKWTAGSVPPEVAPLLKALADLAKDRGRGLPFEKLQEVVKDKVGELKGRTVLRRWIQEAGGEPWFKK
jgi:hypothetical protein